MDTLLDDRSGSVPGPDPDPLPAGLETWVDLADRHAVWGRVGGAGTADGSAPTGGGAIVRQQTVALVDHLASLRRGGQSLLAADPWQDLTFAARMTERTEQLIACVPDDVQFSAAEAALLVAVPFLHDALWSGLAGYALTLEPHDLAPRADATPDRAAFERFVHGYPRLRRRAVGALQAGRRDAAEQIGWWLLHRWLGRRPVAYQPETVASLLSPGVDGDPAAAPLAAARLAELLRALRADPGFLSRTDRGNALAWQVTVGDEQIRERFVGYLLATAHALAIETITLPDVLADHLGIGDPVVLPELHHTIARAEWEARSTALVLDAECGHPAVEVALRGHVDSLRRLLSEIQLAAYGDASMRPLKNLTTHVTGDDVRPATEPGGRAYQSAGMRFRLAEDRVQELLMGEQLYGDPALAIRELYQNALDACRYREARTAYLRRSQDLVTDWTGQILFEQGVDADGRPYLDCVDNGVGMGVRELGEVFSQAGVRLADLPEFVEEQAEWARLEPPVRLFPNSRFGIGVLSYFMLADEITVDTCRLGRDGRPGERLQVSIAGPGNLFRIRSLGPGTSAGTTIRLHLRAGVASCVDVLRKVLWVADFHTEAVHGAQRQSWLPGQLSAAAPLGGADAATGRRRRPAVVPAPGSTVWWCDCDGAILADGLWAGRTSFGTVVNLSRELAPQLSVDRTKILAHREEDVDRLLRHAVPAVATPRSPVLTFDWLCALAAVRPLVADMVFDSAVTAGHASWQLQGETVEAGIAGCFPPDAVFADALPPGAASAGAWPEQLAEWRLTALGAAGRYSRVLDPDDEWQHAVRARPSDFLLMSANLDGAGPWLDPATPVPLVHLLRAAHRTGRAISEVSARLTALGYLVGVARAVIGALDLDPDDLVLTSRELDGVRPWLDPAQPVRLIHLLRAAHRLHRPVGELAARLTRIGYHVVVAPGLDVDSLGADDLLLASRDLDGGGFWLDLAEPVPLVHLLRAAHRTGRPVRDVAARLGALGYHVPAPAGAMTVDTLEADDFVLTSRDLDGNGPWLDAGEPVPLVHLLRAAYRLGVPVREVAARVAALGYLVTVDPAALDVGELTPDDAVLTSRNLDGAAPWLDVTEPVPVPHLLRAAQRTWQSIGDVAARLAALGHTVAVRHDVFGTEADDLVLVSRDLDETEPWLDPAEPVPAPHLVRAAQRTGRTLADLADRLTALGYVVAAGPAFTAGTASRGGPAFDAGRADPDDLLLASCDVDGIRPWLDPRVPVPPPHLLRAARRTRRSVRDIVGRLRDLGYAVTVDSVTVDALDASHHDADDLVIASRELNGSPAWLDIAEPVSLVHLLRAALRVRRPVGQIAARLAALGYAVPDLEQRLPRLKPGGL